MVVLLEGSPISTEELWSSVRMTIVWFLVTSLTKALLPPIAQFGLVVSNFFHLWMMEATLFFGTFNAADLFIFYPSPDLCLDTILSRRSTDNSFDLIAFALTCAVNWGILYRQVCDFPIMSNQLNLPQVDFNQVVETSQGWSMETGCTWAQFNGIAKGLNTYVNVIFTFLIFYKCAKMSKNLFSLRHDGVLCVDWEFFFNQF